MLVDQIAAVYCMLRDVWKMGTITFKFKQIKKIRICESSKLQSFRLASPTPIPRLLCILDDCLSSAAVVRHYLMRVGGWEENFSCCVLLLAASIARSLFNVISFGCALCDSVAGRWGPVFILY